MNINTQNAQQNNATKCFYPMLVPSRKGAIDSGDVVVLRWKKFKTLPEKSRDVLLSEETPRAIKNISQKFQLASLQAEEISRLVRDVFFGDIGQENIADKLTREVGLNEQQAQIAAQEIKNEIFSLSPEKHSSPAQKIAIENLPILQALKKYPGVGEQLITASPIELKNIPDPARPSVKNWIMDYRHTKGDDVYEDLERGNYLFHGKNTVKLTLPERQKLSLILKSLDNNIPLPIDTQRQQIVFSRAIIGDEPKTAGAKKQPIKSDWNKIKDSWQRKTNERERNGRQSISKEILPKRQIDAKSLGSVRDFSFSSPQELESEKSLDNLKCVADAETPHPLKPASNDLDDVHSALKKRARKLKSHRYQIYPIGSSVVDKNEAPPAAGHKAKPKIKGNIVDLKGEEK